MVDAKPAPKFDNTLLNEVARVLFITDQILPEGKTFDDVRDERKQAWIAAKKDYTQKARKLLNVAERRKNLIITYVPSKVEAGDLENAQD